MCMREKQIEALWSSHPRVLLVVASCICCVGCEPQNGKRALQLQEDGKVKVAAERGYVQL